MYAASLTHASLIESRYFLLNGRAHSAEAALAAAHNGIAPLSNDISVPAVIVRAFRGIALIG